MTHQKRQNIGDSSGNRLFLDWFFSEGPKKKKGQTAFSIFYLDKKELADFLTVMLVGAVLQTTLLDFKGLLKYLLEIQGSLMFDKRYLKKLRFN